jgi:hypothetical protein
MLCAAAEHVGALVGALALLWLPISNRLGVRAWTTDAQVEPASRTSTPIDVVTLSWVFRVGRAFAYGHALGE